MAPPKKPKAEAEKAPETEAVKPSEVLKMVPVGPLNSLLSLDKRTKKQQAELGGELGNKVGDICERYGTNRKALGTIRMLNRMEIEKVADFLDHLYYLLDLSGIEKRAEQVQKLPLAEAESEKDEGDAAADQTEDGKVTRPRFGAMGGGNRPN